MSNDRLKRTLEFDLTDAPMLAHAMRIAACTALMCGHKDAQKRLDQYQAFLAQLVPPEAKHFEEEVWAEIGMALGEAKSFRVTLCKDSWRNHQWVREGRIVVHVDDRTFDASKGFERFGWDAPELKAVFKMLTELAPMGCEGILDTAWQEEDA